MHICRSQSCQCLRWILSQGSDINSSKNLNSICLINIYFQYFASQTFSSLMIYQIYWSLKVLLSGTRTRYRNLNWSLRRFDFFFQKDEFPSMLGAHGSARILKQLPEFFNIDSDLDTALETFNKRELVKWFVDNLLCFHSVNNMHLQDF